MAQEASTEEKGSSRAVPTAENKSGGPGTRDIFSLVGHDTTAELFHNPGVFLMAQSGPLSSPLHKHCSDSLGRGIFDLGCTDTLCGEFWLDHYLRKLGPDDSDVHRSDTNAWFVFWYSGTKSALYRVDLTVQIGGRVQFLRTHVVSGETPLLIGRRSMARMRMRIDAANNTVTQNLGAGNFTIRCDVSSSGHLLLSLWDSSHRASL